MDSLITAAARALARGAPLDALKLVALRDDPAGLALRGIAMAQLGDLVRSRELLRRARRAFAPQERVMRARCVVAEAEVALAARDLSWPLERLTSAQATLARHGDLRNAAHARYIEARRLVLCGQLAAALTRLEAMPVAPTPVLGITHALLVAHIAMRQVRARAARSALDQATQLLPAAMVPALAQEVAAAWRLLEAPAARLLTRGREQVLSLAGLERRARSTALIVDGLHLQVRCKSQQISLATRPVLFTLAQCLAEAWPQLATREVLARRAFRLRHADDSVRARLRVEIGRLRRALHAVARIEATAEGFVLRPAARSVQVLRPVVDESHAALLSLLADRESWSTSALALALGTGQRSVQRSLQQLVRAGKVRASGHGRARRWVLGPVPGITTLLLLPPAMATH